MIDWSDTETLAFSLRLRPGKEAEYLKRHDELWPEMKEMLLASGILHYEIYLEEGSDRLFGHIIRRKDHTMASTFDHPVNRRWRAFMSDVLQMEGDRSIRRDLRRMFALKA